MKKIYIHYGFAFLISTAVIPCYATITLGGSNNDQGTMTLSGALRANYQDTDYGYATDDRKIKFDATIFRMGYNSPKWFGNAEYRCYQYETFCDFSTLVSGYAGYRMNEKNIVTAGLQAIPFGPSRFWDSSFYAGINSTMGLQDVLNLGLNYHTELSSNTKVDLAYFATDGGKYNGDSRDAARYTANLVSTSDPKKTDLNEKNMLIARVIKDYFFISNNSDLKLSTGASYWFSEIENKRTQQNGERKAWSIFALANYHNFSASLTSGKINIDNGSNLNYSTLGSFDSEYNIANEGYFYTFDSHYTFKDVHNILNITPYLVLSGFDKSENSFKVSQRNIVGVAWDYKNVSLYTEYVMSKNDVFIGGNSDALATGDASKINKLLNVTVVYKY